MTRPMKSNAPTATTAPARQLFFSAPAEVQARIKNYSKREFTSVSEAILELVQAGLVAIDSGVAGEPSRAAQLKEQSASVDVQMKEIRLAQIRKEILTVDSAAKLIENSFAVVRQDGLAFMTELAREFGVDVADLQRRFLERMAGGQVKPDDFEEAAEEFSTVPLR
jgi:hypothetical protein